MNRQANHIECSNRIQLVSEDLASVCEHATVYLVCNYVNCAIQNLE